MPPHNSKAQESLRPTETRCSRAPKIPTTASSPASYAEGISPVQAGPARFSSRLVGRLECDLSPTHPPSPPWGHGHSAVADGGAAKARPAPQQDLLHRHPSHSSLELARPCGDPHHVTHTVPRGLRHLVPTLRAQSSRPSHEGCPTDGTGPATARLMEGWAHNHIPRAAPVPRSHTHSGAAPH